MFPALPPHEGYHRHWFIDMGDRLAWASANGWAYVLDGSGARITRDVGEPDEPLLAYAMEAPDATWREQTKQR